MGVALVVLGALTSFGLGLLSVKTGDRLASFVLLWSGIVSGSLLIQVGLSMLMGGK